MSEQSREENSLIGRESNAVPGRFGEPLTVTEAHFSRGNAAATPSRPLFICLHGWGSNEDDLADLMRHIAPYNDYVALRAPLVLQEGFGYIPGAYSWFHDGTPTGADLDRDAFAAASAVDRWISEHIDAGRQVIPLGFSQGGLLAIHLLRVNPSRYRAAISLSGFIAPNVVHGSAPADDIVENFDIPTFYAYGDQDTVVPKYEIKATAAWLEEHTWATVRSYPKLDHAVSLEELSDLRDWLVNYNISSGLV